jgi:alcohol dehydrogenase class IV
MSSVMLDRVPRIIQGIGALESIGGVVAGLRPRAPVMLVVDPGLRGSGMIETASQSLRAAGLSVTVFDEFKSDPSMAQADLAAQLARAQQVASVVSLGGGSAMDLGKTVAAIAAGTAPARHYGLCANAFPGAHLASVCIPTTSGTGSEATRTAVLSDAGGAKVWLWGDELKADVIVLDPLLTRALPAHLTAATGIDALVHAIEASTNRNANAANDLYCHEAIRLVVAHLQRAVESAQDLSARAGLQWAATFAGIGIDNCGTAIAHNIGHALASLRAVHHGRAVGLAMRATLEWNVQHEPEVFAAAARAMGEADARRLPAAFERLLRAVGVKVALTGEGFDHITASQLAQQMAHPENEAMRRSNRRPVEDEDLLLFANAVLTAH